MHIHLSLWCVQIYRFVAIKISIQEQAYKFIPSYNTNLLQIPLH